MYRFYKVAMAKQLEVKKAAAVARQEESSCFTICNVGDDSFDISEEIRSGDDDEGVPGGLYGVIRR